MPIYNPEAAKIGQSLSSESNSTQISISYK